MLFLFLECFLFFLRLLKANNGVFGFPIRFENRVVRVRGIPGDDRRHTTRRDEPREIVDVAVRVVAFDPVDVVALQRERLDLGDVSSIGEGSLGGCRLGAGALYGSPIAGPDAISSSVAESRTERVSACSTNMPENKSP